MLLALFLLVLLPFPLLVVPDQWLNLHLELFPHLQPDLRLALALYLMALAGGG